MRTFKTYYSYIHCGFEEMKLASFQSRNWVTTKGEGVTEEPQKHNGNKQGFVLIDDSALAALAVFATCAAAKELFTRSYRSYRRRTSGPTVWGWLSDGVKNGARKGAAVIKNWDPE